MKTKPFRLEPVLRIRRLEERAAALSAAQATAHAHAAESSAKDLDVTAAHATVPISTTSAEFTGSMMRTRLAAADASQAWVEAAELSAVAKVTHADWTSAAQRMKGLERLKERHVAAVQREIDHAEVRAVDDIVTRAYVAQSKQRGHQ